MARGWGTINLGVAFWMVECAARTGNRKLTDVVKLLKEFHDKRIFASDRYYLFADGTIRCYNKNYMREERKRIFLTYMCP